MKTKNILTTRSVTNIIPNKKTLEKKLKSDNKLNIYYGIDPTATRIHLGHAVGLRKLQQFVQTGHNVTLLIGDFTALIGDTSDKDKERPVLTYAQIKKNFETYKKQASKLLDFSKVKVVHNSEWLKKLTFEDIIKLAQHFSVGDFINRELIKKRLNSGKKVALHEVLYPVMQGYDSYYLDTDIQIGGADQTFNMAAGRTLQKDLRKKESFVLVTGYLEGTDGRKMSKSWGNAIWLEDKPEEMYAKVMSLRDELIESYLTYATNLDEKEIDKQLSRLKKENPIEVKKTLAWQIVSELHCPKGADKAALHWSKTFQKGEPVYSQEIPAGKIIDSIAVLVGSKTEAKRLVAQNAVSVNDNKVGNPTHLLKKGDKVKIGVKIFATVR